MTAERRGNGAGDRLYFREVFKSILPAFTAVARLFVAADWCGLLVGKSVDADILGPDLPRLFHPFQGARPH